MSSKLVKIFFVLNYWPKKREFYFYFSSTEKKQRTVVSDHDLSVRPFQSKLMFYSFSAFFRRLSMNVWSKCSKKLSLYAFLMRLFCSYLDRLLASASFITRHSFHCFDIKKFLPVFVFVLISFRILSFRNWLDRSKRIFHFLLALEICLLSDIFIGVWSHSFVLASIQFRTYCLFTKSLCMRAHFTCIVLLTLINFQRSIFKVSVLFFVFFRINE